MIVDPNRCFGFARCVDEVPEVFRLNEDGRSVPGELGETSLQRVIDAAWACPRQAITVLSDDGLELPESMEARA